MSTIPNNFRRIYIWDFTSYITQDPTFSALVSAPGVFIEDAYAMNVINNELVIYQTTDEIYTICSFTPSATSETTCTVTDT